jgi:CDP-diacylglycerol--inositol 3-phosphatidyltransferase
MRDDHVKAAVFYIIGSGLDAADGYAARYFKQGTKFGAVLDMVTDRFATTLLLVMLSVLYPSYTFVFQFIIAVDIVSHWMQMYSSLLRGGQSHKDDEKFNFVMALYYYRPVLFLMCAGNELFFAMLYLVYFTSGPTVTFIWSFGLWKVLLFISFPICFVKNCINLVQLVQASQAIAEYDTEERQKSKSQ